MKAVIVFMILLSACGSMDRSPGSLIDQILTPKSGSQDLHYNYCAKEHKLTGTCEELLSVSLKPTPEIVDELVKLKFVCKSKSRKIYIPCFQKEFGMCFNTETGWGPWKKIQTEFTTYNSHVDHFLNDKLRCFSFKRYNIQDV